MSKLEQTQHEKWLVQINKKLTRYKAKLTVKDVADILGCGKEAIRKRVASGKIQSVRVGRSDYIAKDWLISYLQTGGGLRHNLHDEKCMQIVSFCSVPRTREEIRLYIGYSTKAYTGIILRKLMAAKYIKQTEPSHSNHQKYIAFADQSTKSKT